MNGYFVSQMIPSGQNIIRQYLDNEDDVHDVMHEIFVNYFNYIVNGMPIESAYDRAMKEKLDKLMKGEKEL